MKSHIWMSPGSGAICARLLANQVAALAPGHIARRWISTAELKSRQDEMHRLTGIVASLRSSLEGTPWEEDGIKARMRCAKAHKVISAELARRGR